MDGEIEEEYYSQSIEDIAENIMDVSIKGYPCTVAVYHRKAIIAQRVFNPFPLCHFLFHAFVDCIHDQGICRKIDPLFLLRSYLFQMADIIKRNLHSTVRIQASMIGIPSRFVRNISDSDVRRKGQRNMEPDVLVGTGIEHLFQMADIIKRNLHSTVRIQASMIGIRPVRNIIVVGLPVAF